ncbi:hypothetical protein [Streptomyces huiliensis]|uniref:hypothetical protein n=1 Tax=Streptomyces huiliensis TaxID=2876027 RepID=UPI001CC048CB|nr:hypothetical protein [Streptomyces huiliensis]MBZ4317941.1 hypothetical protein [Streptomyces huiliensis]
MNDEFPLGSYVVDTRTGRLGQVMDTHAGYVQLRPPRGGIEWSCPPSAIRFPSEDEAEAQAGAVGGGRSRGGAEAGGNAGERGWSR